MEQDCGALVITGAARGIGARVARQAAAAGTPVAVLYRSRSEEAWALVRDIESRGGRAMALAADIGDQDQVASAFDSVDAAFGGVQGLVNNAVLAGDRNEFLDWSLGSVEAVFRTNVFGAFLCAQAAVQRLSTRHGGRGGAIVSMSSSIAINTGAPHGWIPFAASKSALETMSHGLAREFADDGVRVNVVRVGVIDTETRWTQGRERVNELVENMVPMKRIGQPDEVAKAVVWLLSRDSSYVTGATLSVAGGL